MLIKEKCTEEFAMKKLSSQTHIEPLEEEKPFGLTISQHSQRSFKILQRRGFKCLKNYVEYKQDKQISIVAEEALQQLLLEVVKRSASTRKLCQIY